MRHWMSSWTCPQHPTMQKSQLCLTTFRGRLCVLSLMLCWSKLCPSTMCGWLHLAAPMKLLSEPLWKLTTTPESPLSAPHMTSNTMAGFKWHCRSSLLTPSSLRAKNDYKDASCGLGVSYRVLCYNLFVTLNIRMKAYVGILLCSL